MANHAASRGHRRGVRNAAQTQAPEGMVWDKNVMRFVETGKESKVPVIIIPKGIPEFMY